MISKYVTQTRALNVSLIYMIQGDAPFWKNGYDCSMQRGVAYTRPTGLSSFPAIASFPGSPPLDHWPNIISIIQTHDRVALAPSHSGTTRGGDGGGEVGECDSMQGGDVNTTIATKGSNKNNSGGGSSRSVLSFTGSWRRQRKRTESEASFLESLFSGWGGVSSSMLPGVTATSSVLSESKQSPTVTLSSSNNNREVAATTSTTTTTSDVVETEVNVAVESNKSTSAAASTTAVALSVTSNVKPRPISASNKSLGSLSLISADECNDYTIDETPTGSSRLSSSSSHILSGSAVEAVNYNAGSTSSATPTIRRSTTTSITSISSNTNSKSVSVWTMVDAAPHSSTTTNTSAAAGLSETSRPRVKFYDRKVDATYALAGIDGRLVLVATHLGAWNSKNRGVDAENNASGGVDGGGDSTSPTTTSNDALFVELCVTVGKMLRHEIALSR